MLVNLSKPSLVSFNFSPSSIKARLHQPALGIIGFEKGLQLSLDELCARHTPAQLGWIPYLGLRDW